jgi:glycerol-3-phosphate acyltransferase PlsY
MLKLLFNSYLLGSIPFAYIFAWQWRKVDIRRIGSENVGTTNVFKQIGCDAGKGIIAVMLGNTLAVGGEFIALPMAMIGHNWPVWLGFHGGGGLATFIGGMLVISKWWIILILLGVWGIAYLVMKSHDRSAFVACSLSPIILGTLHSSWSYFLFGVGSSLVVGIKRLFSIKLNNRVNSV